MTLLDRFDPPAPRHVYRWDLDKTYLRTEFDTLRDLLRAAFERAEQKANVPGTAALMRELRANGPQPNRICIVSGSPRQMRSVLDEKLQLDGNTYDELVLKPNLSNVLRGRFRAVRGQVGYKLPSLLASRAGTPAGAKETLFGDDAESDAFVYSLYADLISGAVSEGLLGQIAEACELYDDEYEQALLALRCIEPREAVGRIFIHLDRRSPPARFGKYGPRLVPIHNYFQAALVLMADGHLGPLSVLKVAAEMIANYGYSLLSLGSSFQDLLRRGLPVASVVEALGKVGTEEKAFEPLRPVPDILAAFARRVTAFVAPPSPLEPSRIDYLALLSDAHPRRKNRESRL